MSAGLVITRTLGESILLTVNGERILITVTELRKTKCRLKFNCERTVKIDRLECLTKLKSSEGVRDGKDNDSDRG